MEALWSKFLPQYTKVQELLSQGKLGTVKSVLVNFGFRPLPPVSPRLYDPLLGVAPSWTSVFTMPFWP